MAETTRQLLDLIAALHRGEREAAREGMAALWGRLAPNDCFHRCVLAHYMADTQDDVQDELAWDLLALEAAEAARPEELDDRFPGMTLASFFPSLHLNLASDYERTGNLDLAREHARRATSAAVQLDDSPIAKLTADAIVRLRARLDSPHRP